MSQPALSAPRAVSRTLASELVFPVLVAIGSRIAVYAVGYIGYRWLGRYDTPLQAFCHFDCILYGRIADGGYGPTVGLDWAFFPLFPLVARGVATLTQVETPIALLITGNLAFVLAVLAIYRYGREQVNAGFARSLVLVCSFSPYSIYFSNGYSESLFLLATALAFLNWSRERFWRAGLAAAAATATRLVGTVLAPTFAVAALSDGILLRLAWPGARDRRAIGAILLAPVGFLLFTSYVYWRTGDPLGVFHAYAGWGRVPGNPIVSLWNAFRSPHLVWSYLAMVGVAGLCLAAYLGWKRRWAESVFLFCGILAPASTMAWGMPRYVFGLFPVYVAITMAARDIKVPLWLAVSALALIDAATTVGWVAGLPYLQ